ncbi:MAG: hypothetical protein P8X79_23020 [Reinekea sp.]
MDDLLIWSTLIANLFTVAASSIAIYLFIAKKKQLGSLFRLLINYSYQLSLTEVKEKIERLNEYNARDPEQCENIVDIFNEIIGQIKGNDKLRAHFSELLMSLEHITSDKRRLTEPKKRALVSELRERLRHLNVSSIDSLLGESE